MEWQKKIYDYEENPPGDMWGRISGKLDEEPWMIRKNLSNYEVSPPVPLWQEIYAGLGEVNPTKRKTLAKIFRLRAARIPAAAALAGGLLLVVYYFISNPQIIRPSDIAANIIDSQKSETLPRENSDSPSQSKMKDRENDLVGITSVDTTKKQTNQVSGSLTIAGVNSEIHHPENHPVQLVKRNPNVFRATLGSELLTAKIKNSRGEIETLSQPGFSSGYVTITGDNGEIIRVSAKLRNIIHYMQGADNQFPDLKDQYVSENNYWQKVFREWKQKVSSAAFIPDGGNFFDIVELLHFIQENK